MLSKLQFADLIKTNFMWPGYNWYLKNTANGLEGASNEYIDGTIDIILDYFYQRYVYIQRFTDIFDLDKADIDKEKVGIKSSNSKVVTGDLIRIYGTQNYDGEYEVIDNSSGYVYVGNSYIPEIIPNSAYYTVVSLDRYTESDATYFDSNVPVENSVSSNTPVFLPHIGYKIGLRYDPALTIDENRRFIKSAIDIYRIKGSILSIKRLMTLMGYECEVVEPHKLVMRYGISKYDFIHHYQDWRYYHDGVFEIVTDNISLNQYKETISTLVQPVGTRLVARANINLGLVPFLGDVLTEYSNSYFTELRVRLLKAGNIFDEFSHERTRSGNVDLFGLYADIGVELGEIVGFRRVWDSRLFSLSDLSTPNIIVNPARRYSVTQGAFSSDTSTITGWTCPYDELSQLDIQLDLLLTSKNERPAMRSEFARRSGDFAMSGLDGNSWNWKPYYLVDFNYPIQSGNLTPRNDPIDLITNLEGYVPYSNYSGDIFSVNRWFSGVRSIYGLEVSVGFRTLTLEDWSERIYWSWDDTVNIADFDINTNLSDKSMDRILDPCVISSSDQNKVRSGRDFFSGDQSVYDIEVTASN